MHIIRSIVINNLLNKNRINQTDIKYNTNDQPIFVRDMFDLYSNALDVASKYIDPYTNEKLLITVGQTKLSGNTTDSKYIDWIKTSKEIQDCYNNTPQNNMKTIEAVSMHFYYDNALKTKPILVSIVTTDINNKHNIVYEHPFLKKISDLKDLVLMNVDNLIIENINMQINDNKNNHELSMTLF